MLEVTRLAKAWPDFRLDVSLRLGDGEIGALLGPSGCGKSTFLRLLTGLLEPDSGRAILDGQDLGGLGPDKRGIGMVFQDFALFPSMNVRRNIEYGPRMRGMGRADRRALAEELAATLEIGALLDRYPATLSGGEQQRVALARTLAARPRLVLLDEPLSSLDAGLRRRLRSEIAWRLRAAGVMALHVTHDVEEALAVADRIFLMSRGRIIEEGAPEALYARPSTAYGARFLARGPVLPLLGLDKGGALPRASTPIGTFVCSDPGPETLRDVDSRGKSFSLFFPAESPVPLRASEHRAAEDNVVSGRVVDSVFTGRSRRLRIDCPAWAGDPAGATTLEIEVPPETSPARGELLSFLVPPERCILLPEDE